MALLTVSKESAHTEAREFRAYIKPISQVGRAFQLVQVRTTRY